MCATDLRFAAARSMQGIVILWMVIGCVGGWLAHALLARWRARAVRSRVTELHAHAEHASMLARVEAIFADHEQPLEQRIAAAFAALRQAAPIDRVVAVCQLAVVADGVPRIELERARREVAGGGDAARVGRELVFASEERTVIPLCFDGADIGVLAIGGREGVMHSHALEAACTSIAAYLGRAVARAERSTIKWTPELTDDVSASA